MEEVRRERTASLRHAKDGRYFVLPSEKRRLTKTHKTEDTLALIVSQRINHMCAVALKSMVNLKPNLPNKFWPKSRLHALPYKTLSVRLISFLS